jgi:hypothetical protein
MTDRLLIKVSLPFNLFIYTFEVFLKQEKQAKAGDYERVTDLIKGMKVIMHSRPDFSRYALPYREQHPLV